MAAAVPLTPDVTPDPPHAPADVPREPKHNYHLVKELGDDIWLIERDVDNHQFVGFRWNLDLLEPEFFALLGRGAGDAVAAVLSHPNLVSHIDVNESKVFKSATAIDTHNYAICDYCDAGTLRNFIDRTSVRPKIKLDSRQVLQWLPESLVWHVAISMLSALAWLHDGVRIEDQIHRDPVDGSVIRNDDGSVRRNEVETGPFDRAEDWFPILHRDIRTDQIFFQHPKGIETYGFCKLGGFGRVYVSGHMHGRALGTVITSESGTYSEPVLKEIVAEAEAKAVIERELAKDRVGAEHNEVWIENYDTLKKVSTVV